MAILSVKVRVGVEGVIVVTPLGVDEGRPDPLAPAAEADPVVKVDVVRRLGRHVEPGAPTRREGDAEAVEARRAEVGGKVGQIGRAHV